MTEQPPSGGPEGPLSPRRRSYTERPRGPRDRDAAETAMKLRVGVWSLIGVGLGFLAGSLAGHPFLGALVGGGGVYGLAMLLVGGAGRVASTLHAPSGATTPRGREHSRAESLLVRGHYAEAVEAFQEAVAGDPTDPTPYLRIARIHRDHLGELETAAAWFRRALRDARVPRGTAVLARRELVELYVHRMKEPRRAAPELARMVEEWEGTEEGEWAARELAAVKEAMRREDG